MVSLGDSLSQALGLILSLDPDVVQTVWTSLSVSLVAVLLAALMGIPLGCLLALARFRGRRFALTLLNTLMALPTVVVGLLLYGLLSRQGPLGPLGLLFTPTAMVLGQLVLAIPIIAHYSVSAVAGADARILPTLQTLGAGRCRSLCLMLCELRFVMLAGVVAGFGRVIAEVGVAMMLGGNIRGSTRTMTTAIALETSKGEFVFALSLGVVLMLVALLVNLVLNFWQQR